MAQRMLPTTPRFLLTTGLLPALALACAIADGAMAGDAKSRKAAADSAPTPHAVYSRSLPVKSARTALAPFDTAPFPYSGRSPGGRPFHDVSDNGRRGHTSRSGRVLWEDETFSDNRVLLHIPKGFDVRRPGIMVVFLHGHGATLERDVRARQRVPQQISASGANAVLVAPQLAFDARDSSAGKFWEPGAFAKFTGEAAQKLAKLHGDKRSLRTFASMPVVIVAYSGGYVAAAACAEKGGLKKRLRGIVLLDALYGELDEFAKFIDDDPSAFFVSAYLGSTRDQNARLGSLLEDRDVQPATNIGPRLKKGTVAILPGGAGKSHRDLVTRGWVDNPIQDLLSRLREYRR